MRANVASKKSTIEDAMNFMGYGEFTEVSNDKKIEAENDDAKSKSRLIQ